MPAPFANSVAAVEEEQAQIRARLKAANEAEQPVGGDGQAAPSEDELSFATKKPRKRKTTKKAKAKPAEPKAEKKPDAQNGTEAGEPESEEAGEQAGD